MLQGIKTAVKAVLPKALGGSAKPRAVFPVVRMEGMIQSGGRGLSSDRINYNVFAPMLQKAFATKNAPAVVLVINSPGGSPVQSSLLYKEIRRLKKKHSLPVHAFVEDMAASGGYYIACAADDIICDESSIVGSIGVISQSFGCKEAIAKVGLESRILTAGRVKNQSDMFGDVSAENQERTTMLLSQMHDTFKGVVAESRGGKMNLDLGMEWTLKVNQGLDVEEGDGLYDGSVYDGKRAVELGFADKVDTMSSWMESKYSENDTVEVKFKEMKKSRGFPFGGGMGAQFGALPFGQQRVSMDTITDHAVSSVLGKLKEEELWGSYGVKF